MLMTETPFPTKMYLNIFLLALVTMGLYSASYAKAHDNGSILISTGQNKLYIIDLHSQKLETFANIPNHDSFRADYVNMQKIDNKYFLFDSPLHKLGIYDVDLKKEAFIFDRAYCPVYFKDSKSYIFFRTGKIETGFEQGLYQVDLFGDDPTKLKDLRLGDATECPVKLNENEAVVFLFRGAERHFRLFNSIDRTFEVLNMGSVVPVFGLDNGRVFGFDDSGYLISDINGGRIKRLDEVLANKTNMFPVAYFREINAVLVNEYREPLLKNQISNLWILDLDTFKSKLLVEGIGVQKKGAVFLGKRF